MARVDYRDIVIQTCFDAVEKTMRDSRCTSTALLARKYHILKGVCYKSGDPIPMCLRNDQEEIEIPRSKNMQEAQVTKKIERDICQDKSTMLDDRGPITAVSGQNDDSVLNMLAHVNQTDDSTSLIKEVSCIDMDLQQQLVKLQLKKKLEYQLVHRGRYEHLPADPNNRVPDNVFRPEELVIKVSIPLATSAKGIDVDVSEQMLRLSVDLDVVGNYEPLELALPFPVIEDKSCARFDRKKHHLVITLPVQPPKSKPQSHSLVVQDDDEEAENKELPQNIVGTPESSKMVATEQTRKGEEGLLMLQKTTSMVAKDPQVVVNNPLKAQRLSPTAVTSSPRSAVTELAATKDDISDNLPPLTSCGDEETDTLEPRAEEMKSPSNMLAPVKLASKALKPIKPYFETHDTLECLSYIVGVAGIDSTSVKLTFPSDSSLHLQFADSEKKVYEMLIAAFPVDIDPSTAEFDVASENMVVILRKSNTQLSNIEA
ncbi:unnamed protein product [Peronospora belbahrii]|nr:unnamed protein product [Peronospora belbahrii]CAH0474684.1 unnamed protein product [Peronospora belbahrii]